jgi:hypothetical protein
MPDDDSRTESFAKRFARAYGYDRMGAYIFVIMIAYLAGCTGIVWLIAALASHFAH